MLIEVVRPAAQDEHRRDVRDEADDRDDEHGDALHLARLGVGEPTHRLDGDGRGDHEQDHAVDERREHLDPLEPEGVAVGRGSRGDDHRDQRDDESDEVGEHVPGVGEQRERAASQRADDLEHQHRRHDGEGDREARAIGGVLRVIVRVSHVLPG